MTQSWRSQEIESLTYHSFPSVWHITQLRVLMKFDYKDWGGVWDTRLDLPEVGQVWYANTVLLSSQGFSRHLSPPFVGIWAAGKKRCLGYEKSTKCVQHLSLRSHPPPLPVSKPSFIYPLSSRANTVVSGKPFLTLNFVFWEHSMSLRRCIKILNSESDGLSSQGCSWTTLDWTSPCLCFLVCEMNQMCRLSEIVCMK